MYNPITDRNQPDIVKALKKQGFSVQLLSKVGQGVPDLLVGYNGRNLLLEVKDGPKAKLNDRQLKWHAEWKGQVGVIRDVSEAALLMSKLGGDK